MKPGRLHARDLVSESHRQNVVRDVGRILQMMAQRGQRVLARRRAVWKTRGTYGGIAHRRGVERKEGVLAQLQIIEHSQLHEEIMGMLAVDDGPSEGRFTHLQELGVTPPRHRRGLEAQHGAQRQCAGARLALRHGHEPVGRENLVAPARPALLNGAQETHAVEHQSPAPAGRHQHGMRSRVRLGARARRVMVKHLFDERTRPHLHRAMMRGLITHAGHFLERAGRRVGLARQPASLLGGAF